MHCRLWSYFAVLSLAANAPAALVTNSKTQVDGKTFTHVATLGKNVLQVQMSGVEGSQLVVLDLNKESVATFDHGSKTVHRFELKEIEQTMKTSQQAMKQLGASPEAMKQMLSSLPPEQRKQIEAMLGGRKGGKAAAVVTPPKKIAGGQRVGKWKCDRYEQTILGQKLVQCFSKDFTLNAEEKATGQRLQKMMQKLMDSLPIAGDLSAALQISDALGIAVETVSAEGGAKHRTELVSIERTNASDASLSGPSGYKEAAMPKMPTMKGR